MCGAEWCWMATAMATVGHGSLEARRAPEEKTFHLFGPGLPSTDYGGPGELSGAFSGESAGWPSATAAGWMDGRGVRIGIPGTGKGLRIRLSPLL